MGVNSLLTVRFFDKSLRFDLDEHMWINEAADLHHARRRPNVAEDLTMGLGDFLPIVNILDIDSGANHVLQACPAARKAASMFLSAWTA